MSNKLNGKWSDDDLIAAGFHRVENIQVQPPKIQWGRIYCGASLERRVNYAEKLASAMNHAAYLIQKERDELDVLCQKKEQQLESMKKAMEQNQNLLQSEVTRMNEDRQKANARVAVLNAQIKDLTNGNHS